MIITTKNGTQVKATKCPTRPRFKQGAFGRTWQWGTMLITSQGVSREHSYTYDNTWGSWWYFEYKGHWYKVNIFEGYEPHYRMEFIINDLPN